MKASNAHIDRLAAQEPAAPQPPFLPPARIPCRNLLQLSDRRVVFCRPVVVPVAELWCCLHQDAGSRVGRIRLFCHSDVPHSLRIICCSKTDASARFAQQSHRLFWWTAVKTPGGPRNAAPGVRRIGHYRSGDRRGHDGGMANTRSLLLRAGLSPAGCLHSPSLFARLLFSSF
jgi:hypothetical protein